MRIKLPLDKNKNYIIIPYANHTLAVFEEQNFQKYCSLLDPNNERAKRVLRIIQASSHYLSYNRGWSLPKYLLSYMDYSHHLIVINSHNEPKYSSYIIKKPE